MSLISLPTVSSSAELLPGYHVEPETGAWLTLPWSDEIIRWPSLLPGILAWCAGADLDGEPRLLHHLTGDRWEFTRGQLRFLHCWYAVDERLRWRFRSGVKRGAKGTGKDPFGAAIALIEMKGPVRPVRLDGELVVGAAHRMSLVQIGANSEAQAKDLLRVANGMVSAAFAAEIGWDPGETISKAADGSRIELLTRSEKSSEGDPATAILLNETHHMTRSSGGYDLAGVGRRNVGKSPGGVARMLELTNAHLQGEGSVAEDAFDAWQAQVGGTTRRADILYDSREAPPHLRMHVEEELEEGIRAAYGMSLDGTIKESPWTDLERIRDEAQDLRVPIADSVRYYFNALPTNETAWIDPRKVDALAKPGVVIPDGEPLALFLDCSKSQDATVLVGARISDGYRMALGSWQRPHGDRGAGWLAPRSEVDTEVRACFETFRVCWFGVDPSPARDDETEHAYWAEMIDGWHRDFAKKLLLWATPGVKGNAVLFDMRLSAPGGHDRNRMFTEQAERTTVEIDEDGTFAWDGDTIMRQHLHNARRRPNQWGVGLGKQTRDSKKLVDYAVAIVGAGLGRRLVLNSGKLRGNPTGRRGVVL